MSEEESQRRANEEPKDEVEAHRRLVSANEEPQAEGEESDEVEAHRMLKSDPKS